MSVTGVYAGTFDPVTNGHMDIISRAVRIVDHLVIGVAVNTGKAPLFDLDERTNMVETEIAQLGEALNGIEVRAFEGLLVDFAAACNAVVVVRGLRAVTDFDYEFQMASMNAKLDGGNEFAPQRQRRNHVPDGVRIEPVHLVPPGQGNLFPGRRHPPVRLAPGDDPDGGQI